MQTCIEMCWKCRHECQQTLFEHCLAEGGKHVESEHVKLMMDCIDICQLSADLMVRNSPHHAAACAACAEICEACAASCAAIDDARMTRCAEICRSCAELCRDMSQTKQAA